MEQACLTGSIYSFDLVHRPVFNVKIEITFREQGPRLVAREYGKDIFIPVRWAKIPKTVGCTSAGYVLMIGRQQSSRK